MRVVKVLAQFPAPLPPDPARSPSPVRGWGESSLIASPPRCGIPSSLLFSAKQGFRAGFIKEAK